MGSFDSTRPRFIDRVSVSRPFSTVSKDLGAGTTDSNPRNEDEICT